MKLPNAEKAIEERGKITDYLLDAAHPDDGGKAAFFHSLGFRRVAWRALADGFLRLARAAEVAGTTESPHGRKYVMVGRIRSPDGRCATVQTIWIIDSGCDAARLVTAYPQKGWRYD